MEQGASGVVISVTVTEVVNYALQQNRLPVLRELIIENNTSGELRSSLVRISAEPALFPEYTQALESIPAGQSLRLTGLPLALDGAFLAGLTERITGRLTVSLEAEGQPIASCVREITALAFDQWHGAGYFPELLTAFVLPNHPALSPILQKAAALLEQWTNDPSLDAYQTRDPNRVRLQAAAVFGALQARNLVYAVPPASFEDVGQRVRLCDAVLEQQLGTCLDLSVLYAACLEAIGLHPLLLLQPGHAFAGVWLEELTFPESVQDDPALITKRLAAGVNEIAVVECTAVTAGNSLDFDAAAAAAAKRLNQKPLDYVIDVTRARLSGIRPLPLRVRTEDGRLLLREEREPVTSAPTTLSDTIFVKEASPEPEGKLRLWERRLLDLGLRNGLINLRLTQNMVPIFSPALDDLEDALSGGAEYGIGPRPAEYEAREEDWRDPERTTDCGAYGPLIQSEFRNRRLRSWLGEKELSRAIVGLYRASRTSLEENGANTLYLALGLLRWYETKSSQKPRYAPIILIPVEIVRKSALKGYVLRLRDEEPQMNITLLEMLKQDFSIQVGGLDPLPQDEHGVDVRTVFTVLRKAVMDRRGWDVLERCVLGIFSFSQFVMWNDLRNRSEDLAKNKIIRSLMDGHPTWEAAPMELGSRVPEEGVLLPIPADASQLYAIEAAAQGGSFVLHGPPGTGKSQTITALIANCLAQGKTVLFVAEKMAALSVVQRRLEGIGIGPFCLELHSNKSRKRDVLEQLRAATEVSRNQPETEYAEKAQALADLRQELDGYAQALHRQQPWGLSLYDMVSGFEACSHAPDTVVFPAGFADTADKGLLNRQRELVGQIIAAARAVGHPQGHPLTPVGITEASHALRRALPEQLRAWGAALERQLTEGTALARLLELPEPETRAQWQQLTDTAQALEAWTALPRTWAAYDNPAGAMPQIFSMAQHRRKADELAKSLLERWTPDFLNQDGEALRTQWRHSVTKWFLPKYIDQKKLFQALAPFALGEVDKSRLSSDLDNLVAYRRERGASDTLLTAHGTALGPLYQGDATNWSGIAALAASASKSVGTLDTLPGGPALRKAWAGRPEAAPQLKSYCQAEGECRAMTARLLELLALDESTLPEDGWLQGLLELCRAMETRGDELREWALWNHTCRQAEAAGLSPLVEAYRQGLPHDQAEAAYYKGLYRCLIEAAIDRESALRSFSGALFNEKIARFKKLDGELTELTRQEIFCRLAARIPNFTKEAAQNSEVGILQRAIRSGGRGVSIRRLFEQLPTLLPRLCPCMLMSPLSAAQYLDPKRKPFDLVVFDEASQMPTCKAAGALARGENAVIVGDPKQMPPTSFFSSNTPDEENPEAEDLESILEDCLALHMPQTHLLWHYRSRHESLIAFSNGQFYENKLYTFPSVNDLASRVHLVQVDGFFDRGKTRQNLGEARAIVAELQRRCHDPSAAGQSVGVVTFNIQQQNLIEDLLTEVCKEDSALESWAYEGAEPLFIKNLENVQGDERDAILFSVGYGPDREGKVSMNFGPLNRDGGWRRLNVAVTRARQEMTVFSTLTPDKINLSRTGSQGVAALRAFLEYAAGGTLPHSSQSPAVTPGGIHGSICQALQEAGYGTRAMVGHSGYRIDVGVIDPRDPERYLLGILLDGPAYGSAKTTRDRELAQISVLRGLGWSIHRIWTADWWDNREKELQRILSLLEKRLTDTPEAPTPVAEPKPVPTERFALATLPREEAAAPVYRAAALPRRLMTPEEWMLPEQDASILSAIKTVLEQEAPVNEGLLQRRVLQSFGISRAGAKIQARLELLTESLQPITTWQDGQKFYWTGDPDAYQGFRTAAPGDGRREAKDVPWQEAANALCRILEEQVGLPREDLLRETGKLLGYARSGPLVSAMTAGGLRLALAAGKVSQDENGHLSISG
ncbi:MAG: DUF3320 domain-containing protein [Candidatus Faecousia sp.]|nr:DUF3320 domain-containing protein [Candidatus Faecousia sp.]